MLNSPLVLGYKNGQLFTLVRPVGWFQKYAFNHIQ